MKDAVYYDLKEDQECEDPEIIIKLLEEQLNEEN